MNINDEVEKFLKANPTFINTEANVSRLVQRVQNRQDRAPVTAAMLQWALDKFLSYGWTEFTIQPPKPSKVVATVQPTEPIAPPAEIPEHELPDFPVKLGNETGWSYACRLSAWREQRLRKELRSRQEAERVAENKNLHPDTIRKTKADQQFLRARADKFNRDRTNVNFSEPKD